ncbi:hypothetical protein, partial [Rossellomorea marisflavi]|uniref:hypothetical protein n=1 Tax=Rossellomorea marisflavi TaxID=189381 RepID=UPI003D2F075D
MIGNMGIAILFCNEYVVERRPFRSAAAAFHGACGEPLRLCTGPKLLDTHFLIHSLCVQSVFYRA